MSLMSIDQPFLMKSALRRCRRRSMALLVLIAGWMGCDPSINATNPFDPEASAELQRGAEVVGRVVLPEQLSDDLWAQIEVSLRRQRDLSEPFQTVTLDSSGLFSFTELNAGRYQLLIALSGFETQRFAINLEIGELTDLGDIPLQPRVSTETGEISVGVMGTVERSLSPEGEHGGILIEAFSTPFATVSASDGRFYLRLPPGQHTLVISSPHYVNAEGITVQVGPESITQLNETIRLNPLPSQLRGSVSLEGQIEDVPLSSVVVRLFEREGQASSEALQTTTLDEYGRFIFDGTPVQQLWVQVSCEGFYTQLRPARVLMGQVAEVGHFNLALIPVPEPPSEAPLRGRVNYLDQESHAGITVEVRRAGVLVAAVGTEASGEYALNLDTADYTLSFSAPLYLPETLEIVWDEEDLRFEVDEQMEGSPLSGRDPVILRPELSASLSGSLYSPLTELERGPWPEVSTIRLIGERGVFELSADPDGTFAFIDLYPGLYGLEIEVENHLPLTRVFDLPSGGIVIEEPLPLIPLPPEVPATLSGRALLARGAVEEGNLSGDHAGIIVIAREIQDGGLISVDVAGSAVTNSAGEYRVTLNRSDYQIQLSSDGYVPRSLNVFWSQVNLRFEIEQIPEGSTEIERIPLANFTALLGQNLGAEGDVDLDGVNNGVDNCPNLFNPPEIFGEPQADLDGDGRGDPCDPDQDGDAITDSEERAFGLDPRSIDSDADRLSDGLEVRRLATSGVTRDTDRDGREDDQELVSSTPEVEGILDLSTLDLNANGVFELNEFDQAGFLPADYDGDGIIDALESLLIDSDGDRAADQIDGPGPDGDLDGDGFRNGLRDAQGVCLDPVSCDPCPTLFDTPDPQSPDLLRPLDTDGDGRGDACDPDDDNDGELDEQDLCRLVFDPEQLDTDLDGRGDACDLDDDNDGLSDEREIDLGSSPIRSDTDLDGIPDGDGRIAIDNCILTPNPNQLDRDQDRLGDACDTDDDQDQVLDEVDNCPLFANPDQLNTDGDGFGDVCDLDDDNDGVLDDRDNCVLVPNPDQGDSELDGLGNACDDDDDNDGVLDEDDNCVFIFNPDQLSSLGGVLGDACSLDIDGDGIIDGQDNCLEVVNPDQSDLDLDGFGDVCDVDPDGDLLETPEDNCPFVFNPPLPSEENATLEPAQLDSDEDGIGDACDDDDDNDGVPDLIDSCPDVLNVGTDQDRDGFDDACDVCVDTPDPLQRDFDGDGIGDACDEDLEGDGVIDTLDNCVTRYNPEQIDLNADGVGDACERRFENLLTDRDVTDLAIFGDEVWVSSESGGLTQWVWDESADEGLGAYLRRRLTTSEGAPSNRVKHLAFNRAGDLKMITDQGLVTHFAASDTWDLDVYDEAPERCRGRHPVIPWAAAIDLDIYRIDDTMYVAFEDRIVRYRGGQYTCWIRDEDLPDFQITGVDVNPFNGDVWVSTQGGAYRYNQQRGWRGFTRPILRSDLVSQVGFTQDEVWVFSTGTSTSHVILSGPDLVDSVQRSGWPHAGVMADVTESIGGVHTPTGTVWRFEVERPGLVTYSTDGVELPYEVEFHPTPLDNRGGPLIVGPQGQLLHQGYQLVVQPRDEDQVPTPITIEAGTVESFGALDFGNYAGPAPDAHRSVYHPTLGMWSAHADRLQLNETRYTTENDLPNHRIRDVALDAQLQVWIATAEGVTQQRSGRFYTYYPGSTLDEELAGGRPYQPAANEAYATTVDRDNRGWFGTRGGVFFFDGVQVREVLTEDQTALPPTYSLHIDERGILWAGTARGLYQRVDKDRDSLSLGEAPFAFVHRPLISGHEPMITQLASTFDGRLFGASPQGLFVYSLDGTARQYTVDDGLPAHRVHDVFVINTRPDPIVWVSTDAGLTRFTAPPRELAFEPQSSVVPDPYPPLRVDEHGITWVTLQGGYLEAAPSDPSSQSLFLFPFEISQTEITHTQWASLTGAAPPSSDEADLPAQFAEINALTTAVAGLSTQSVDGEERTLEIPIQSEWELAALGDRLQHHTLYPWAESFPFREGVSHLEEDGLRCDRAFSAECGAELTPSLERALGQTPQGLYGMGGDAAEWVIDREGHRLVGGSAEMTSSFLRLSSWIDEDSAAIDTLAPPSSRGVRLVTRPVSSPLSQQP